MISSIVAYICLHNKHAPLDAENCFHLIFIYVYLCSPSTPKLNVQHRNIINHAGRIVYYVSPPYF